MSPRTRCQFTLAHFCNPVVEGAFPQHVPTALAGGPMIARPWRPAMSVTTRTGRRIAIAGQGDSVVVRARRAKATPDVVVVVVRPMMSLSEEEGTGKWCVELDQLPVSLGAFGGSGGRFGDTATGESVRKCDTSRHYFMLVRVATQ
mmetsp:Transcript_37868/g.81757  ORF Transcript_37868/g.81757 Transcript_37868/m.81757 type:complete len:146 (+) Transcript_37868:938-1375(+)